MKSIIIFLLLASVVWAGDSIDWNKFKDSDFICACPEGYCPCSMQKQGHCPHCGAKGDKIGNIPVADWDKDSIGIMNFKWYMCPNGHLYWSAEK